MVGKEGKDGLLALELGQSEFKSCLYCFLIVKLRANYLTHGASVSASVNWE